MFLANASSETLHHVSENTTWLFAAVLVGLVLCLAFEEKIHAKKSVIAGFFALISLLLAGMMGILPMHAGEDFFVQIPGFESHKIAMPYYITAIDWNVICIILGSSLFVDVTSRSGLFTWVAIKLTKLSKGDPHKLLWFYGLMTVVFSAVLNNVTAMIIVGSLTAVSLDKLNKKQLLLGFLLTEGLLTNIGGLLTLISSVPNIIVGKAAQFTFIEFFQVSWFYVAMATVLTLMMGAKIFKIQKLQSDEEKKEALHLVSGFDENDGIESKGFFNFATVMLLLFIVTIAATSALPVLRDFGMAFVAMAFALFMLFRYKSEVDQFYRGLDWDLLGFFAALFVVINVMEHAQVLVKIGDVLKHIIDLEKTARGLGTGTLLLTSAGFSSVTDNIPLAAMLSNILENMDKALPAGEKLNPALWWSVIFGANLGGNITPIGSASTLVAVTIIHKHKIQLSFAAFVKKAIPFALFQILLAIIFVVFLLKYFI